MGAKSKAYLNLVVFLLMMAVNLAGALGLINGQAIRVVSDRYRTLLTPTPFTFGIWGFLYLLLLMSLAFMALRHARESAAGAIAAVTPCFLVSSVANILWVFAFCYEWLAAAALLTIVMAASLARLNRRLKRPEGRGLRLNALAFGLYGGWAIVAALLGVSAYLVKAGWGGFGLTPQTWALIMLGALLLFTLAVEARLQNAALPLPLAWACFGIWMQHRAGGAFLGQYPAILAASALAAFALIFIASGIYALNTR